MALRASGNRFCRRSLKGAAKSLYRCERRWAGMEDSKKTTCILTHPDPFARETLVGIFASASLTVSAVCADWPGTPDAAARIFAHAPAAGLATASAALWECSERMETYRSGRLEQSYVYPHTSRPIRARDAGRDFCVGQPDGVRGLRRLGGRIGRGGAGSAGDDFRSCARGRSGRGNGDGAG